MIARIWTGATRDEDADAYEKYMREVAVPGYTNVPGHRTLLMLRRPRGDGSTEFTMLTCWDDMDSIIEFAGPDPELAVFYPRDEQFLVDRDLTVRHYRVYGSSGLTARGQVARLSVTDRAAAEELFTACYPRLAGWVRRLVDDDDTAHEIASEAFTRLLARWRGLDSPQGYLNMIAANLVRDHWRRAGRERRAISVMTAAARPDPGCQPVQDLEVRALIQALPASMRGAFLLHYYAGFALREVAVMLGRPEGTVKSDLSRARARLRAAMAQSRA